MAWVYILQSVCDKRFYIGSTTDLQARLRHHYNGLTPTTKRFGKLRLAFSEEYKTLNEARAIEKKLKKLKRKDYIEKIVKEGKIRMHV